MLTSSIIFALLVGIIIVLGVLLNKYVRENKISHWQLGNMKKSDEAECSAVSVERDEARKSLEEIKELLAVAEKERQESRKSLEEIELQLAAYKKEVSDLLNAIAGILRHGSRPNNIVAGMLENIAGGDFEKPRKIIYDTNKGARGH